MEIVCTQVNLTTVEACFQSYAYFDRPFSVVNRIHINISIKVHDRLSGNRFAPRNSGECSRHLSSPWKGVYPVTC